MRLKGPLFPSFLKPLGEPKTRLQYRRHSGTKQQLRNLRHACRSILNSSKPEDIRAKARVTDATKGEPNPEFGFLHLLYAAIDASDQTGESFATAMNYLMDQFDNMRNDAATSQA